MAATHKFSEDSIKLALLIASTFDSKGLLNDARLMEGHGGLVKPPPDRDTLRDENGLEIRREYKFLVHYDGEWSSHKFNGIMDIQIAHLLSRTTDQTHNITVILDCSDSGRMAQDPLHPNAKPKGLPVVTYERLQEHLERLREEGQLEGETYTNGSSHAVHLAAAAAAESAYKSMDEEGKFVGILTKQLVAVLQDPAAQSVLWRTTLFRFCELVNFFNFHSSILMLRALPNAFSSRLRSAMLCLTLCPWSNRIHEKPFYPSREACGRRKRKRFASWIEATQQVCSTLSSQSPQYRRCFKPGQIHQELPVPYRGALAFLEIEALCR
ncbi:hypothetical protein IWX49DRAFT_621188 [Phyllosticta citricarpa]